MSIRSVCMSSIVCVLCIWLVGSCTFPYEMDITPVSTDVLEQVSVISTQYIGTPYIWGGQSLQNGVDCSGFVIEVYKLALQYTGASLLFQDASVQDILECYSITIDRSEVASGDIIFMGDDTVSHIAIYLYTANDSMYFVDAFSVSQCVSVRAYPLLSPKFKGFGRMLCQSGGSYVL